MRLSYGDATDLYRINLGWANQRGNQPPGFILDLERGYWSRNQADDEDPDDATAQGRLQRVVPYVKDTKNALVMRFEPPRSGPEMASLQAAFKEAIQKHFQLEPRELSCEPMPSPQDRQEILFYEASEGGAGVLRQLAEDPAVLPLLARRALEICHFDPDTLEDKGAQTCGKACYDCLLDYGNQPDHKDLDRHLIRDLLAELVAVRMPARRWRRVARRAHGRAAQALRQPAGEAVARPGRRPHAPPAERRPVPDRVLLTRSPTSSTASTTPPSTSTARPTTSRTRSARTRPSRSG